MTKVSKGQTYFEQLTPAERTIVSAALDPIALGDKLGFRLLNENYSNALQALSATIVQSRKAHETYNETVV